MVKYEIRCSNCGHVLPVLFTDPSQAPNCPTCKIKMDALALETEEEY